MQAPTPYQDETPVVSPEGSSFPPFQAIPFPASGAGFVAFHGHGYLMGWSIRESTGGAPARADIINGDLTNGALVATIPLLAGAADHESLGIPGIEVSDVFVNVAAGSVVGAIWVAVD